MTLQPVNEQQKDQFPLPDLGTQNRQLADSFCKKLTASDTSTHGGFSVPRRAAEKVFPPLDFTKQPPAQDLHAKDLHNHDWTFRHIYRGQPKRHLLTSGWSVFLSAKQLVAGDSVLFMRDDKGQLLLGIQRANRQQTLMPSSVLSSDSMHIGVFAAAAHAAATSSRFQVFYNPRTSPSEFVIPLAKYRKAVYGTQISVGMRFRMVFETEESTLRRYMGTITGIGDLDPGHWPGSKWRNLEVGWDESSSGERPHRVSVWEIEPVTNPFLIYSPSFSLSSKRLQHPSLLGHEADMDGNMKRCFTGLHGEYHSRDHSSTIQSLGRDTSWVHLQQQAESTQTDLYNVITAAGFQDFKGLEAPMLLHQPQQTQFRLLQHLQQPLMQQEQQQHMPWPQSNPYQQQLFQDQQQPHTQPPQSQLQPQSQIQPQPQPSQKTSPAVEPQPSPMSFWAHLQHPFSYQHSFPTHQHHQQQLLSIQSSTQAQSQESLSQTQQQAVQISEVPANLLQLSSSLPQASLNFPVAMRPCTIISESESAFESADPLTLQGMMPGRSHLGAFISDNNGQPSNITQCNHSIVQQPQQQQSQKALPGSSSLQLQERQITGNWLPSTSETNQSESMMLSNMHIAQSDTSSTMNLCSLSEPLDHPLFLPPTTGSFQSRGVNMNKHMHGKVANGDVLVGSFCSSSGSFTSGALNPSLNTPIMANGCLDEDLMQQTCNKLQTLAPVRTFTKVHKLGSVGRSIDLSRFKNYDELRRELAHMFNLEGQLEDPQRSCWQLVFVDNEKDILLVGDDPWDEFVICARTIKILSPAQALQMNHEGLESPSTLPMQQQTSSSTEECQVWKDTRPTGASLDHGAA